MRYLKILFFSAFFPVIAFAQGTISTIAGNGNDSNSGDGGPATNASFRNTYSVAVDNFGNLYIVDKTTHRVRRVDLNTGMISTFAGTGSPGFSGDGGPANQATFREPHSVSVNAAGDVFITDIQNFRIRKVDRATGIITTVAGNGIPGFSGDGGPATSASMNYMRETAHDSEGNLYIADVLNHRIRKVDVNGIITTYAGTGNYDNLGDGGPAIQAGMVKPTHLAVDSHDNLYFTQFRYKVRKIDKLTGIVTTIAGTENNIHAGNGGPANMASLSSPDGIAFDKNDNLYIAETDHSTIRRVDAVTGIITSYIGNAQGNTGYAGDGGPYGDARLRFANDIAFDTCGNMFIDDHLNFRIRKVSFADCYELDVNSSVASVDGISMFPNPAFSELTIVAGDKINKVRICDAVGRVVCESSYNNKKAVVNVSPLSAGVYFVRVNDLWVERFVKQ